MSAATDLHEGAIVVDTAAPTGCPGVYSTEMARRLEADGTDGRVAWELLLELDRLVDAGLADDGFPAYWEGWRRAGVDVASVTVGVFGAEPFTRENAVRDLARWTRRFAQHPELLKVDSAVDILRAHDEGRHGVLLHFADTAAIGRDLGLLEVFRDFGVRSMQLTYNTRNLIGDGCSEAAGGGLSRYGRDVVRAMNELGVLVDLAHAGDRTATDAIEMSAGPCAVTHSACRALVDLDRAAGDDVLRAIGESGGYFGVLVTPFTIATDGAPSLDRWLAHVEHAVTLAGIDAVGIGTDWGVRFPPFLVDLLNAEINRPGFRPAMRVDWGAELPGFASWLEWPTLTGALLGAGYSEDEVRGLIGGNFLRVFEAVGR